MVTRNSHVGANAAPHHERAAHAPATGQPATLYSALTAVARLSPQVLSAALSRQRGNSSVRATTIQAMQQAQGNRATRRAVQRLTQGGPVAVQRDGMDFLREDLERRRGAATGKSSEDVEKERALEKFGSEGGKRATAEAQGLTPAPLTTGEMRGLTGKLKKKQNVGPLDPLAAEKDRTSRLDEQAANKQKAVTAEQQRAIEKVQREIEAKAQPLRATGEATKLAIENAHPVLQPLFAAEPKIMKDITDVLAALDDRVTPPTLNSIPPLEVKLADAVTSYTRTKSKAETKYKSRTTERMNRLTQGSKLDAMVMYNAPNLRLARTAADAVIAASEWFNTPDKMDLLEAEAAKVEPTYKIVKEIETLRLPYLTDKIPALALDPIRTALVLKHTQPVDNLAAYGAKLDRDLKLIERPKANELFENARLLGDNAADTILGQMSDAAIIKKGTLQKKYKTSWDTGGGFSVEYIIDGLSDIVIHAHCEPGGTPKAANGTHWKLKSQKFAPGASHQVSDKIRNTFISATEAREATLKNE